MQIQKGCITPSLCSTEIKDLIIKANLGFWGM